MTRELLLASLQTVLARPLPLPAHGETTLRLQLLMELGRQDLSLARLAEAHWDAVAILAEAGRKPPAGAIYGVWASEIPGHELRLERSGNALFIHGSKRFCSGSGIVNHALITVGRPQHLIDVALNEHCGTIDYDHSAWKTAAFHETGTATVIFRQTPVLESDFIGPTEWYTARPGFWHGACGPAACWAGGALGLVDYAFRQGRSDPHTLAHLGAMHAGAWALHSYIESAGKEIDADAEHLVRARVRALTLRHLIEQVCTDVLRRTVRAFGPHPLALDEDISRRYQELDLYLRQCHAERDLEALAIAAKECLSTPISSAVESKVKL